MKIMENEENRGLFYKNSYEDQLERFCSHLWLSSYSFSHSHTLGYLEFLGVFWYWTNKGKKIGRRRKQASRIRNQAATTGFFVGINLHVCFPSKIWHACYFMWLFYVLAWVFQGVTMFSA